MLSSSNIFCEKNDKIIFYLWLVPFPSCFVSDRTQLETQKELNIRSFKRPKEVKPDNKRSNSKLFSIWRNYSSKKKKRKKERKPLGKVGTFRMQGTPTAGQWRMLVCGRGRHLVETGVKEVGHSAHADSTEDEPHDRY